MSYSLLSTRLKSLMVVNSLIAVSVVISGCNSEAPYAPVSGVVTLDGKPLSDAKIVFEPMAVGQEVVAAGSPSYGRADESGRYTLHNPITQKQGAVVGEHRVRITTSGVDNNFTQAQIDATKKRISNQFARAGEQVTVTDEMAREFLMETSTKVPPETLPARYNVTTELRLVVTRGSNDQANFALTSK